MLKNKCCTYAHEDVLSDVIRPTTLGSLLRIPRDTTYFIIFIINHKIPSTYYAQCEDDFLSTSTMHYCTIITIYNQWLCTYMAT